MYDWRQIGVTKKRRLSARTTRVCNASLMNNMVLELAGSTDGSMSGLITGFESCSQ